MPVFTTSIAISTKSERDTKNLTHAVANAVEEGGLYNGIATVFVPGSTADITTIEFEPGAVEDLSDAFERIAPKDRDYAHNERWGDMNGFSHVRAAMLGLSVTIPFAEERLLFEFTKSGRIGEEENVQGVAPPTERRRWANDDHEYGIRTQSNYGAPKCVPSVEGNSASSIRRQAKIHVRCIPQHDVQRSPRFRFHHKGVAISGHADGRNGI